MTEKTQKLRLNYSVEFRGKRYIPGGDPLPADIPAAVLDDLKKAGAVTDEDEPLQGAASATAVAASTSPAVGEAAASALTKAVAETKAAYEALEAKEDESAQLREQLEALQRDKASLEAEGDQLRAQVAELQAGLEAANQAAQGGAGVAATQTGSGKKK